MAVVELLNQASALAKVRRESPEPDYCFDSGRICELLDGRDLVLGITHQGQEMQVYYFAVDPKLTKLVGQAKVHRQVFLQSLMPGSQLVDIIGGSPRVYCLDHGSDLTDYLREGCLGGCLQPQATR